MRWPGDGGQTKLVTVRKLAIAVCLGLLCLPSCATRGYRVNGVEIHQGTTRRALEPETLARRSAAAVGIVTTDVGRGMAFVVDPRGYLISNRHVIEDADHIEDISFPALDPPLHFSSVHVVYIDPVNDLALLKVDTKRALPHLPLATGQMTPAEDYVKDADQILVLSRRAGLEQTSDADGLIAHVGQVNDLDVHNPAVGPGPYLGVTTDVQRGQSGGPVVDSFGRAVGVVTWTWKDQPGGFAIPIGQASRMLADRPNLDSDEQHRGRIEARAREFLEAMNGGDFDQARRISSPSHAREVRGHTVFLLLDSVPQELVRAYVEALEELVRTSTESGGDPFEDLRSVIGEAGAKEIGSILGVQRQLSPQQVMTFFFEFGQAYIAARVFGQIGVEDSAEAAVQRLRSLDAARSFALAEVVERFGGRGVRIERIDLLPGAYSPRAVVTVRLDPESVGVQSEIGAQPELPTGADRMVLQMRLEWGDWYVAEVQSRVAAG